MTYGEKVYENLMSLAEDMQEVNVFINDKNYPEANKRLSAIFLKYPESFLVRYRKLIHQMVGKTVEEYRDYLSKSVKFYPYTTLIEPSDEHPQLPAIISTERTELVTYKPLSPTYLCIVKDETV